MNLNHQIILSEWIVAGGETKWMAGKPSKPLCAFKMSILQKNQIKTLVKPLFPLCQVLVFTKVIFFFFQWWKSYVISQVPKVLHHRRIPSTNNHRLVTTSTYAPWTLVKQSKATTRFSAVTLTGTAHYGKSVPGFVMMAEYFCHSIHCCKAYGKRWAAPPSRYVMHSVSFLCICIQASQFPLSPTIASANHLEINRGKKLEKSPSQIEKQIINS